MKRTTQLIAIAGMAGLFSLGAVLTSTVHASELPCAHEDSVGCHWDAATQGNGQGDSFTAEADGSITYDDPAVLDKMNPGWTYEELHGVGTDGYVAPDPAPAPEQADFQPEPTQTETTEYVETNETATVADPVGADYTDTVDADYSETSGLYTDTVGATYTVQLGDTLSSIAANHGTTWQELASANDIANPDLIFAGQTLEV